MRTQGCHILPFFIKEGTQVKVLKDLEGEELILRGVLCIKKKLDAGIPLYDDGKEITGPIYYWEPVTVSKNVLEAGIHLIQNGLGFPKAMNK